MSRLAVFIRTNTEPILAEWETFARSLPQGSYLNIEALRDHAAEMLGVIADDLETAQSAHEQELKSQGGADAAQRESTAAQQHGAGRAEVGFTVGQMVAEFRALRASVIRLWLESDLGVTSGNLDDLTRFNEAIDQAIAESIARFSDDLAQSKERFLAILGHDLRTPLSAIITSSVFVLDRNEVREPDRTLIDNMLTSARRMNQMVADLLDFTRTRFGDSIPILPVPSDVRMIIHNVVAEIAASYPESALQVETTGLLNGVWDTDRLTQALSNLVSNAAQHGTRGAPIRAAASGTGGEVVITVHSHGPVIAPEKLETIFSPMKDARRGDRRHLGLGLYIVEKIICAHGGTITVESTHERGTTFTIRLPREARVGETYGS